MVRRLRAHAKLNLSLRVLAREESGYHSIETLMIRLSLADDVIVQASGEGIDLKVSGDPSVPVGEQNLCWQAAERLISGDAPRGVRIRLKKRIPAGAGLGGGSSDAAAVLLALESMREKRLGETELLRIAGDLGSDVPFGLCPSDLAFAWEHGRRLLPLRPPPPRPVLVLAPEFPIRAAEAYQWLVEDRRHGRSRPPTPGWLPTPEGLEDWTQLARIAENDLESPVLARRPVLRSLREALVDAGADITILCGSGSCLAGIFADEATRDAAVTKARQLPHVTPIPTSTLGPDAPLPG